MSPYVQDLGDLIDMETIAVSGQKLGCRLAGGGALLAAITDLYGLDLVVVNPRIDRTASSEPCLED